MFKRRIMLVILPVLALVALWMSATAWLSRPTLTEEAVQQAVITTIQKEAGASFYVTGYLDITATATVKNTKYLLPDMLGIDLGTTRATVRMPGRVSYGFDVRALRPEMIQVGEDQLIEVTLPELSVYAVEPDLSALEVETSVGWARMHRSSGQRVERRALGVVQQALRAQGRDHVAGAAQPRIHTARALEKLLVPVLQAAGVREPQFRFRVGTDLVLDTRG